MGRALLAILTGTRLILRRIVPALDSPNRPAGIPEAPLQNSLKQADIEDGARPG
jgi:hypothetical protein